MTGSIVNYIILSGLVSHQIDLTNRTNRMPQESEGVVAAADGVVPPVDDEEPNLRVSQPPPPNCRCWRLRLLLPCLLVGLGGLPPPPLLLDIGSVSDVLPMVSNVE